MSTVTYTWTCPTCGTSIAGYYDPWCSTCKASVSSNHRRRTWQNSIYDCFFCSDGPYLGPLIGFIWIPAALLLAGLVHLLMFFFNLLK